MSASGQSVQGPLQNDHGRSIITPSLCPATGGYPQGPRLPVGKRTVRGHLLALALLLAPLPAQALDCHPWPDGGTLQAAVTAHQCIQVAPGRHVLPERLLLPGGHTLLGAGQDVTVLQADPARFPIGIQSELVVIWPDNWERGAARLADLTLDAAGVPTYALGYRRFVAERVRLTNASCAGAVISGPGVYVLFSRINHNSIPTQIPGRGLVTCASTPGGVEYGAGIYLNELAAYPVIGATIIEDNYGNGIDAYRAQGVTVINTILRRNAASSAISLYESPRALILDSFADHPTDSGPNAAHLDCYDGTAEGAAVWLCRTMNPEIVGSDLRGHYAIAGSGNIGRHLFGNVYQGGVQ